MTPRSGLAKLPRRDSEAALRRERRGVVTEASPPPAASPDPVELLRSRGYLMLLAFGSVVGVVVAFLAYFFLKAVSEVQRHVFATLPNELGFGHVPAWWPLPWTALAGLLVALTIRYLPGQGGHKPAEGFKMAGPSLPINLPGIVVASLATLCLGIVLGPEAPLIAIGSGIGVLAVRLVNRNAPQRASVVVGAAGSFAAISTLIASPLTSAFLLMEASGLGGPTLGVVLVPGLLAAGLGALIFVGLGAWTGFGTFGFAIPNIPQVGSPDGVEFLWAVVIGLAAVVLGTVIRRLALALQPIVERRIVPLTPAVGLAIGGFAVLFAEVTGRSSSEVLFSGQNQIPGLVQSAGGWTLGALLVLIACKGLAYAASLSCFRGGPTFPGMFIGAAGGIALSHAPGLPMIAGVGMGIGAMTTVMLGLPLTSVLIASLLLPSDAVRLMPLTIVAVVVAYVARARLPVSNPALAHSPGAASTGLRPERTPSRAPAL
jgi:H+/Cl- antiporter ClcA